MCCFQPGQFPHVVTKRLTVIEQGLKWKGKALFHQAAKQHWHGKFELNCC